LRKMKEDTQLAHKKKAVLEALRKSLGVVTAACDMCGVPRRTFYGWKDQDPEFKAAVDEINEVAIDFAENALYKLIQEGNPAATIFYCKTKGKARGYVERSEVEVTVPKPLSWLE
jgi:hypothetical protein